MRRFFALAAGLLLATSAHALSLADISGKDAGSGLKEALTQGAGKAVDLLGDSRCSCCYASTSCRSCGTSQTCPQSSR